MNTYVINTYDSKVKDTAYKNALLRDFAHNKSEDWVMLYDEGASTIVHTDDALREYIERVINMSSKTGIHYFTGSLQDATIIDYGGGALLTVGVMGAQRCVVDILSRSAIEAVGYFDVRMKDSCYVGDYAHRLSQKKLYPALSREFLPWLFDVESPLRCAKHVYDEISSGWYSKKYDKYPQLLRSDSIDNLKVALKELKGKHAKQ